MGARLPHPASDGAPGGLRWPALALLSWAACFAVWRLFGPDWPAAIVASGLGLILAGLHRQTWRRLIVAAGFPLALLFTGTDLPAWIWLIPLAVLVLAYPRRGWSDAPLFPTPRRAARAARACPIARRRPGAGRRLRSGRRIDGPSPRLSGRAPRRH